MNRRTSFAWVAISMLFVSGCGGTIEELGGRFVEVVDPKSGEKLVGLDLSRTQITNEGLKRLANHKNLPFLDLGGTQVTDAGLKELANLKSLWSLSLSNTQVTDAGLKELANLKSLTVLYLNDTKVTDAGVHQLQKALPKCNTSRGPN